VFREPGKENYKMLHNYCSICLLPSVGNGLEKVVQELLSKEA